MQLPPLEKKNEVYSLTSVGYDGRFALESEVESDDIVVSIWSEGVDY